MKDDKQSFVLLIRNEDGQEPDLFDDTAEAVMSSSATEEAVQVYILYIQNYIEWWELDKVSQLYVDLGVPEVHDGGFFTPYAIALKNGEPLAYHKGLTPYNGGITGKIRKTELSELEAEYRKMIRIAYEG